MPTPMKVLLFLWFAFWFIMPAYTPCEYADHSYGAIFPVFFHDQIDQHYLEIRPYDETGFTWTAAIFMQCFMLIVIFGGAIAAVAAAVIVVNICNKIGI
jgi:hypothetical protein